MVHFGASVGVCVRNPEQIMFSSCSLCGCWHKGYESRNTPYKVSRQRCSLNSAFIQAGQKVHRAKKPVRSPTLLPPPPSATPLLVRSCSYLPLTSFETVLSDSVGAAVVSASRKKTSSQLEKVRVALFPLKTHEEEPRFRPLWLCHFQKGTSAPVR